VTRRKVFGPAAVPAAFWRRDDTQVALARREIGRLFQIYLAAFPDCTQTQLALLTEHDRSDISNWVRGKRQGRVCDIEVLTRIADGLQMPDEARVLLGLAPAQALVSAIRATRPAAGSPMPGPSGSASGSPADEFAAPPVRLAICGSRAADTDDQVISTVIQALARLVFTRRCVVSHGPVGIGIEVMTYIADHYHPPDVTEAVAVFGHRNVVRAADFVLIVGGGAGTQDEIDLALSMGKKVIALPASGGTARRFHDQARHDPRLHAWIPGEAFAALDALADPDRLAIAAGKHGRPGEEFARIVEDLLASHHGEPHA
jgi:SLOG cluster4 family